MQGDIAKAFITALRAGSFVDTENVSTVLANDNGEGTIDTALPAIAVAIKGTEKENGEYIGGLMSDDYIVQIAVITNFDNQAASPDDDYQYEIMNLPGRVKMWLAACSRGYAVAPDGSVSELDFFKELGMKYDFNVNYRGEHTEQTRGMHNKFEQPVFITRLIYLCNFTHKDVGEIPGVLIPDKDHIIMKCGCNSK